jgi:hypothetical protein
MDVAHRVASQHRIIEWRMKGVRAAIAEGDLPQAKGRLAGLKRMLEAHFVLEENHYFPVARKARPGLGADLQRLAEEHGDIRSALERVSGHLEERAWDEARRAVAALDSSFRRHEEFESKVLCS